MKKINLETFDRLDAYLFFKELDNPRYYMTFNLDVTKFYHYVKKHNYSFYYAFIYLSVNTMNKIKNFKYRFFNQEAYEVDMVHPSFTDLIKDTENFKIVNAEMKDNIDDFITNAKLKSLNQKDKFIHFEDENRVDMVYITTFPWKSFTQVSHAHNYNKYDAIPRIAWGKFEIFNDKYIMPFSIEVNHAFVDGIHVGKYINLLEEEINNL